MLQVSDTKMQPRFISFHIIVSNLNFISRNHNDDKHDNSYINKYNSFRLSRSFFSFLYIHKIFQKQEHRVA